MQNYSLGITVALGKPVGGDPSRLSLTELSALEEEYIVFPCKLYTDAVHEKKLKAPAHPSAHGRALG